MPVIGNKNINIIQGDTYTRQVSIENVDNSLIEAIYFSCNSLNVCKKLEYNEIENTFDLIFTSEETNILNKGIYNYDLTIIFIENNIKTVQYKSTITILEKNNRVGCYEY